LTGFLVGIFYAGLYAEPPGLSALTLTLAGYLVGKSAPFLMDTRGIVLFVFAFIIFIVNDFLGSTIMSVFYSPFWQIRIWEALSGGIVFSIVCNPLQRIFIYKRI
jgi:cell shape-determining protein MreD